MRLAVRRPVRRFFPPRVLGLVAMAGIVAAGGCGDAGRSTTSAAATIASPTPDLLPTLHPAARCYVEAVNQRALDDLIACFASDAVVVDINRRITGPDDIRRWAEDALIGGRLQVLKDRPYEGGAAILMRWAPRGADGWLVWYRFEFRDGKLVLVHRQNA